MIDKKFARQAKEIMDDNSFFIKAARGSLLPDYENLRSELIERAEKRMAEQADKKVSELIFKKIYCPVPFYFIPRVGMHNLLDSIGNKEDMGVLGDLYIRCGI